MDEQNTTWWSDLGNLSSVAQWLLDRGDAERIPLMIEKPWNHNDEYQAMVADRDEADEYDRTKS